MRAISDLWQGCRESRSCSRNTYPESYITKCPSKRRKQCSHSVAELAEIFEIDTLLKHEKQLRHLSRFGHDLCCDLPRDTTTPISDEMWRCDLTRDLPRDLTRDLVTQVRLRKGDSKPVSLKSIHPQTRQTNFETPFLVTQVVEEIFEIDKLAHPLGPL